MIIPAQVPNAGMPDAIRFRSGVEQPEPARQLGHGRRLAAGDHEAVALLQLLGPAYGERRDPEPAQRGEVLAHVALQGEHADGGAWACRDPRSVPDAARIRNGTCLMDA